MRSWTPRLAVSALLMSTTLVAPIGAQQGSVVTASDYDRAVRFLPQNVGGLVVGGVVTAHWLDGDKFWYRNPLADGAELILVDPVKHTRGRAFDHDKLAASLSAVAGARYDALHLPLESIDLSNDARSVSFQIDAKRWSCGLTDGKCAEGSGRDRTATPVSSDDKPLTMAPDGTHGVFVRDWNLWVRDVAKGEERQLTTDGVKYFGYATDNAGWRSSDRAMVQWSADSTKIATQQQDERDVGEMYLVNTTVGHPTLRISKFPLPGDDVMPMLHRVIIDVASARVTRLQMPPDFHRATLGDDIRMADYNWSPDASMLALASVSRDHKHVVLRVADATTGAVRTVLEETVATQFESRGWDIDWPSKDVVWFSERDNWGQLYLYDLTTGQLKNQITMGAGPVTQLTRLDGKARTIWFAANGREHGQDPYFRHFYRVGMDGTGHVSLTPADGDHAMQLSPSGRYLIDTYSKPDVPPVVVLRGRDGETIMPLEKADIAKLLAIGWKPPMPITMTAHDGVTPIYGLLFQPTNFDPSKKYPIVNNVYPGPQTGSTGSRSFTAARGDRQALAELGFIVVTIDGMGTPGRSKTFQDAYYGAMGRDNTIPDQIAGMKELAQKYPWIDLERAGIWGHSGGGFATTTAMFRFPGVFKVGIAESGNHDQRENEDDWGERYQGLLVKGADGTDNYAAEANQNFATALQGHLLLAHGTMDTNVPPYETMLVAEALIKANKDFDLLMLPNQNHGYGSASSYMMRRRWDYFVKWLLDAEPPKGYEIKTR
jgi:dipeptidyl-peptidase 4